MKIEANNTTFTVKCKNPQCIGGGIQVSIFGDDGYSNFTVMDEGAVEFKCTGCGKFASTETYKKPNEPENFSVSCDNCGSEKWSQNIQDIEESSEPSNMECENCHGKQYD